MKMSQVALVTVRCCYMQLTAYLRKVGTIIPFPDTHK